MNDTHEESVAPAAQANAEGRRKRRMSARWRYTNRVNARASTGPKTAPGKAKVARNAFKHGLSLPVLADPAVAPEVEELARTIGTSVTGQTLDGRRHELACRVAEAVIDLRRVRLAKEPLRREMETDPKHMTKPLKEFLRLDRYEARAFYRRKIAIRAFDEEVVALRVARAMRQNKAMAGKAKDSKVAAPPAPSATPSAEQSHGAKQAQSAEHGQHAEQSHSGKGE